MVGGVGVQWESSITDVAAFVVLLWNTFKGMHVSKLLLSPCTVLLGQLFTFSCSVPVNKAAAPPSRSHRASYAVLS